MVWFLKGAETQQFCSPIALELCPLHSDTGSKLAKKDLATAHLTKKSCVGLTFIIIYIHLSFIYTIKDTNSMQNTWGFTFDTASRPRPLFQRAARTDGFDICKALREAQRQNLAILAETKFWAKTRLIFHDVMFFSNMKHSEKQIRRCFDV